jgi:hypothetical protein
MYNAETGKTEQQSALPASPEQLITTNHVVAEWKNSV